MNKDIQLVPLRQQNSRLLIQESKNSKINAPVVGYAHMPLASLAQACTPLTTIIPDILTFVSIAIQNTQNNPPDGLTIDESASIRLYTMEWTNKRGSLYSILNHTLKTSDREELTLWFQYLKLFLTALSKIPCAPSQTVWRGVKKHVHDEFPRGSEIIWWAFSSCTTTLPVLESDLYLGNTGKRTLFSIEIINGRNIRAHSQYDDEDEILLLPGTLIEVKSQFNPASDLYVIHLKQKIPKEILLEPPFHGARLYPRFEYLWYRKKRFTIPVIILTILSVMGITLGSVFGIRMRKTSEQPLTTKLGNYYGSTTGGVAYNDFQELSLTLPNDTLVAIDATWTDDSLFYINFIYSNGKVTKHGGRYDPPSPLQVDQLVLNTGETISKVTGYTGVRNITNYYSPSGTMLVVGLHFETSYNQQRLFGSSDGKQINDTYDNFYVAYATGRAEAYLDGIQFMWLTM